MPKRRAGQLTAKQEAFVREYLVDLDATKAAIRAGYSKRSAKEIAYDLLQNERVAAAVALAKREASERNQITVDRVLQELARIGFSRIDQVLELDPVRLRADISEDALRTISSVEVSRDTIVRDDEEPIVRERLKVRFWDKAHALDKLGQYLNMWRPKQDEDADQAAKLALAKIGEAIARKRARAA